MSFDTDFDYSGAQSWLTNRIASQQALSDDLAAQIADLEITVGYDDLISTRIAALQAQKTRYDDNVTKLTEVSDEITALTGIPAEDKAKLHEFWTLVEEDKRSYMARILFNHTSMLANANFNALLADSANSVGQKQAVGSIICQNCNIDVRTTVILSRI